MRSVSAATMRHALQRPRLALQSMRAPTRFAPHPLPMHPRRYASASPIPAPRPSELPVPRQDRRPAFAEQEEEPGAPAFAQSKELSRNDMPRFHRGAPGSHARSKGKFDVWCKKMTAAKTLPELDDVIGRMATSRVNMHLIHYNIALSRYYLLGSATKAELLLASMKNAGITPDIATYNVQLNHSISEHNDARTAALLQETQKLGLQPNDMTHSLLAKHWVNQGDFKSVELLLDNLTARNVVPSRFFWSKLIDGYARQGNAEAAEKTVERMARLGLEMDIYSMGALLSAYANAGATDKSREVMARVMQQGLKTNSVIWTTYINGLLKEPRVALHKRIANAEEAIGQMRKCRVLVDSHTACTMVRAYNEALQWDKSHAFLKQALQDGLRPSTAVFNSLMSAWVGQGRLEDAEVYNTRITIAI